MDDLHVQGGRHWETGAPIHLAIRDGAIRAVSAIPILGPARDSVDAAGYLVSPAFVEPHYHLDKVLLTEGARPDATFEQQVDAVAASKRLYTEDSVADRASAVARILASRGVACVRTFADVDSHVGLTALEGLLRLRERLRDVIDLQIVAFPQHGLFADAGAHDLMRQAVARGADLIGGHPQLEANDADGHRQIEALFDLAAAHDKDLDFHVDETDRPDSCWLDAVIAATIARRWRGRVCVSHCASLAKRPAAARARLYDGLVEAGVTVVVSPTSGLLFRGHGEVDPTRGIVPVRELLARGIPVACAQEVYKSMFAPNLRFPDPLFTGQIMAYAAKLSDDAGLRAIWHMITDAPAKALRVSHGIAPGLPANLVLVQAESVSDAFARLTCDRIVIRHGRVLVRSSWQELWSD